MKQKQIEIFTGLLRNHTLNNIPLHDMIKPAKSHSQTKERIYHAGIR